MAKERPRLHQLDREWLAASPFCLLATAERPGNRRVDGFRNILVNPHVGLVFFVPGRGDTLRINGRARLVRDAPFLDAMVVKGHRPVLVVVADIEQHYGPSYAEGLYRKT